MQDKNSVYIGANSLCYIRDFVNTFFRCKQVDFWVFLSVSATPKSLQTLLEEPMKNLDSIFDHSVCPGAEKEKNVYQWEKPFHGKDDVRELRKLLNKLSRIKAGKRTDKKFSGSSFKVRSKWPDKIHNQRVMFKMTYSKAMSAHDAFRKLYMTQQNKESVEKKPELFGTPDEEYEKNKVPLHFKCIISPERQDVDLRFLTREFIYKIEQLTGYEFYWQGAIHNDKEHRHVHLVINGKDKNGKRVRFDRGMISNVMRAVLSDTTTQMVGQRTKTDIEMAKKKLPMANRWTELDEEIAKLPSPLFANVLDGSLQNRLAYLQTIGLASKENGRITLNPDWQDVLKINSRYNSYLAEYLNSTDKSLHFFSGGSLSGRVDKVFQFGEADSWNDALVIDTGNERVYVPVYQLNKLGLQGKYVQINGGDGGLGRQISDRNIRVLKENRDMSY